MLTELTLPAPAKLNLFLYITGKRADGYHNLQTLFQFLDIGDELTFTLSDSDVELTTELIGVAPEDNLIVKAARLLQQQTGCQKGVRIALDKQMPMGGGLGGGSSNAATTLLALNVLWNLNLSVNQLADFGLKLGADVPVFVRGFSAFAEGVGEILTPVSPPEYWFLVAVPDVHVNTAAMFGHQELTRDSSPIKVAAALEQEGRNDFQPLVRSLYPEVDKTLSLLDNLADSSIGQAVMSGSGASVFARFASREQALAAQMALSSREAAAGLSKVRSFVARGMNCSPLVDAVQCFGKRRLCR
ncbi:4-(cytidine 5'-diphospho)-2-C-methyl-D-erythritol kinase [uncultured Endozoicomonas sp.]|uniref:4-(cytidine 5'-diphospho)-2-C-methyl-D-erythritol kinase n=1 Tax=uncultured Endozoicomonas sp. TaxID=432652 RepID=UPI0026152D46|nr:4-(cytidine 5'-diphospho)-2-C-methyl-D-erythritol kinase [uncultured Endozoicomonas sp.]